MLEHEEAIIPDLFYLEETGITRISPETGDLSQLVNVSELPGRLTGHQSGPVYSVWMPESLIAQSPVWDDELALLDTHDRRLQVVEAVRAQGGIIPTNKKDTAPAKEIAITQSSLQEDFHLVPLKDPIFLRKEDVAETDDPVDILEKAMPAIQFQHDAIVAQMSQRIEQFEQAETRAEKQDLLKQQRDDQRKAERLDILRGWLEEATIWYTSLSPQQRQGPIISLSPLVADVEEPVLTSTGKVRQHKGQPVLQLVQQTVGYLLVVGMSFTMPSWKYATQHMQLPQRAKQTLPAGHRKLQKEEAA